MILIINVIFMLFATEANTVSVRWRIVSHESIVKKHLVFVRFCEFIYCNFESIWGSVVKTSN